MLTFLEINGFAVEASDPDLAAWIIGLSTGTTPAELAERLRARARPLPR
jgi:prophage maintenance system killer protein